MKLLSVPVCSCALQVRQIMISPQSSLVGGTLLAQKESLNGDVRLALVNVHVAR